MTHSFIRSTAVLLLAVLWISSCSKKDSNPVTTNNSTTIFALVIGNQWIYQNYTYDSASGTLILAARDTAKITRDTLIQGEKWFTSGNGSYSANRSDGNWEYDTISGMQLNFKYPAQVNDSYKVIIFDSGGHGSDTEKVKVLSINQSVTVPAGTFSCVTYQWSNPTGDAIATFQFAPGIGLVYEQLEEINPANNRMFVFSKMELLSYSLK